MRSRFQKKAKPVEEIVSVSDGAAEELGVKPGIQKDRSATQGRKAATQHEYGGHRFKSRAELWFYQGLLRREERGEIDSIEVEPRVLLQPGFREAGDALRGGVYIRPIEYYPDFRFREYKEEYGPLLAEERIVTVEVKGFFEEDAKLKVKMYRYKLYLESPGAVLRIIKPKYIKDPNKV